MSFEFLTPVKIINFGKITDISPLTSRKSSMDNDFIPRRVSLGNEEYDLYENNNGVQENDILVEDPRKYSRKVSSEVYIFILYNFRQMIVNLKIKKYY